MWRGRCVGGKWDVQSRRCVEEKGRVWNRRMEGSTGEVKGAGEDGAGAGNNCEDAEIKEENTWKTRGTVSGRQ